MASVERRPVDTFGGDGVDVYLFTTSRAGARMKLRTVLAALATLFLVSAWAGGAAAQDAPGDKVEYKKKTVIDLSGATIEGELTKPEGSYIVNRKLSRFSTLIQARGDFFNELVTSHNEL